MILMATARPDDLLGSLHSSFSEIVCLDVADLELGPAVRHSSGREHEPYHADGNEGTKDGIDEGYAALSVLYSGSAVKRLHLNFPSTIAQGDNDLALVPEESSLPVICPKEHLEPDDLQSKRPL